LRAIRHDRRRKNTAVMRHLEGCRAVLADARRNDLALFDDRIDVKDLTIYKPFDQELRGMIAPIITGVEFVQDAPNLIGRLAFSNAKCRYLVPRLNDPRSGYIGKILRYFF